MDEPLQEPFLKESSILSDASERILLKGWLSKTVSNGKLLYRSTRDGFKASQFHALVDGKGPTISIVKSTKNFVAGGYTSVSWDSKNGYYSDS